MAVLEKIRVKMGTFITVLIGVALLSFIIDPDTLQRAMSLFSSKYDVGEMNGEGISYQEYQKRVDYYNQIYQITNGSASNEQVQEMINNSAWQGELTEKVLIPASLSAGVNVGKEELLDLVQGSKISPILLNDAAFLDQNGEFDKSKLTQFVQAIPHDESGNLSLYWNFLQKNIEQDQIFTKYLSLLDKGSCMSTVELNRAIAENNTTYNVDFVLKPFGFMVDSTIKVSKAEVKEYYEKNKEMFRQVGSRDIEYAVLEVVPSNEDIDMAEKDMEKVYDEFTTTNNVKNFLARNSDSPFNQYYYTADEFSSVAQEIKEFVEGAKVGDILPTFKQDISFMAAKVMDIKQRPDSVFVKHILLPATDEAKADSLLAVIKKGGDFAALAEEYSFDKNPQVAEAGDLGWMTQRDYVPGFEQHIFSAKVGESFKVNTNYGVHIVKVTKNTVLKKKYQVAILVKEAVASKQTYSSYYAKANTIATKGSASIADFNKVAKEQDVAVFPALRLVPSAKKVANYDHAREIVRWANEAEVGDVSQIITVDNKYFFVAALTAIHPDGIAPLEEAAPQIQTLLSLEKKGDKIAQETKDLVKEATTLEAVAEALETTISSQTGVAFSSLTSQQLDPKFIGAICGAEENKLVGPVVGEIGVYYFVVKGKEVGAFYTEDDAKSRAQQIFSYTSRAIPQIISEQAGVVDSRYKFY